MFGLGMGELILILIIALVIFGPSRLPEMGSAVGRTIREFRKSVQDDVNIEHHKTNAIPEKDTTK